MMLFKVKHITIFALVAVLASCAAAGSTGPAAPIVKLGTADLSMVETTPVLWKGQLLRFESVRSDYNGISPRCDPASCGVPQGVPYYRFREVGGNLSVTPPFGVGYGFGSALVQTAADSHLGVDTMYVFGTDSNQTYVDCFTSTDLQSWTKSRALQLGWGSEFPASSFKAFNNAVTRHEDGSGFTMAIELGAPSEIVGSSFTSVFARVAGNDPSKPFQLLDPTKHVYTTAEYSACPTIRQYGSYFYVFTLFITPAHGSVPWNLHTMVVRSPDLVNWEGPHGTLGNGSLFNPVLEHNDTSADRHIGDEAWNYKVNFTTAMTDLIANATDNNNSDIDFCDDGEGGVYIVYSWGNQQGIEFLGAAMVQNSTERQWVQGYFL